MFQKLVLIFVCLILAILIFNSRIQSFPDGDTFWHLATGRYIVTNQEIPTHDPFSFTTENKEWIHINWLSQCCMFLTYSLAGFWGPIGLAYLCILGCFLLYLEATRDEKFNIIAATIPICLLILFLKSSAPVRPQIFSLLFVAFTSYMTIWRNKEKTISTSSVVLLCVMFLLWPHLHGGVIIGLGILGIFSACKVLKRDYKDALLPLSCISLSFFSYLFHPSGLKALLHTLTYRYQFDPEFFKGISELTPLTFSDADTWIIVSIFIFCMSQLRSLKRFNSLEYLAVIIVFLVASFSMSRFAVFFVLASLPMLAGSISSLAKSPILERVQYISIIQILLITSFISWCVVTFISRNETNFQEQNFTQQDVFPNRVVQFLVDTPTEGSRVFSEYTVAGLVIWKTAGKAQVMIDGRGDLHSGNNTYVRYLKIAACKEGWKEELEALRVNYILARSTSCLIKEKDHPWKTAISSPHFTLLEKQISS